MKKIAVMEKVNFNQEQIARLKKLGQVDFYENLPETEVNRIAPQYDVTIVNWVDPTPYLLDLHSGSLVALLSTGYGWISNIAEAHAKGISVANIPNYSTEAVVEHLLGLLLGSSKRIFTQLGAEKDDGIQGFEIAGKTIGIIGLGNIGTRFAQITGFFSANVITYNRTQKKSTFAKDVSLDELLAKSDVIVVTPSVNPESKGLLNENNYGAIKVGAVIIGSTWDIITEGALVKLLSSKNVIAAFDAALEGNKSITSEVKNALDGFAAKKKLFLTPHCAYNTVEAEIRQLDICVANIEKFLEGKPQNIVH
jgi:phosphoglycerate dehydrogenase-like enzyme